MIQKETLDLICQIGIAFFGIIAIILVARKNKWGFVFGLISQPFWLISSFINKQWGIFILSIVYAATWIYGVYNWFYRDSVVLKGKTQLGKTSKRSISIKRPKKQSRKQ